MSVGCLRIAEAAVVVALALVAASAAVASPARGHESDLVLTASEKQAVESFEAQLKAYMKVHRKLEATLPKHWSHATPEQIVPKLEEDLEYRFVGERLVLMDAEARIITDFTDDVLP